jgi:hypothetical protein
VSDRPPPDRHRGYANVGPLAERINPTRSSRARVTGIVKC